MADKKIVEGVGSVLVIEYELHGVDFMDEGRHTRRTVSDGSEQSVIECAQQLYQDVEEKYPASEFPYRKFHIASVSRELVVDYEALNEEARKVNNSHTETED